MKRKYHEWTLEEYTRIRLYLRNTEKPTSLYNIHSLAQEMGLSDGAVRGAVLREMKRQTDGLYDGIV